MNRAADGLKQAERDLAAAEDSAATGHHEWAAFQAQLVRVARGFPTSAFQ